MLEQMQIVLVKTRFPENIGMAARACANMGCRQLVLVAPEWWDKEKAYPLATAKGQPLLESLRVVETLEEALADSVLAIGTTARTGGWRREIASPEGMAHELAPLLAGGEKISLVFGPEDRGLLNQEIELCQRMVTIPTVDASSLNVAQSVLILLYEFSKTVRQYEKEARQRATPAVIPATEKRINTGEQERLSQSIKELLLDIGFLHGENSDYFFMPWRRFLGRAALRRHEYDALMGVCRQIKHKLSLK
ncbi:MAG: RNA methyltransferase [Desulfovibrionaceae bacterium]|nr:RNA methyltransferase [Desulfovibrionaceae bacterium]